MVTHGSRLRVVGCKLQLESTPSQLKLTSTVSMIHTSVLNVTFRFINTTAMEWINLLFTTMSSSGPVKIPIGAW